MGGDPVLDTYTTLIPDFNIIIPALRAPTRKQVMTALSAEVSRITNIDQSTIFDLLMDRERLATSGIGGGISIPHLRLNGLNERLYGLVHLAQPVDFTSMDGLPVDLIAFVLSPVEDGMKHLSRLSRLSRLMRNDNFVNDIRKASTKDMIEAQIMAYKADKIALAA